MNIHQNQWKNIGINILRFRRILGKSGRFLDQQSVSMIFFFFYDLIFPQRAATGGRPVRTQTPRRRTSVAEFLLNRWQWMGTSNTEEQLETRLLKKKKKNFIFRFHSSFLLKKGKKGQLVKRLIGNKLPTLLAVSHESCISCARRGDSALSWVGQQQPTWQSIHSQTVDFVSASDWESVRSCRFVFFSIEKNYDSIILIPIKLILIGVNGIGRVSGH